MPHLIVEYSANLTAAADVAALLHAVHDAALATGLAPLDGLRTRAERRTEYVIADDHPDNAFVAIVARLGPGRSPAEKHALLDALIAAAERSLGAAVVNVMLSAEFQEIDAQFRINRSHLRETIAARA